MIRRCNTARSTLLLGNIFHQTSSRIKGGSIPQQPCRREKTKQTSRMEGLVPNPVVASTSGGKHTSNPKAIDTAIKVVCSLHPVHQARCTSPRWTEAEGGKVQLGCAMSLCLVPRHTRGVPPRGGSRGGLGHAGDEQPAGAADGGGEAGHAAVGPAALRGHPGGVDRREAGPRVLPQQPLHDVGARGGARAGEGRNRSVWCIRRCTKRRCMCWKMGGCQLS